MEKKLNRILRFIEKEGGLNTVEHEQLIIILNRLYVKRLIEQGIQYEYAKQGLYEPKK